MFYRQTASTPVVPSPTLIKFGISLCLITVFVFSARQPIYAIARLSVSVRGVGHRKTVEVRIMKFAP